jgi:LacI family transcriptional regulator
LRAVTIKDVAREADVSIASVSRVLNGVGRVGQVTRLRILDTAERLGYVPHEGARSLITRRTGTVGMILPDLHGEFFSELLRGADAAARSRGLHLLVSTSHGSGEEAAAAIRSMRGRVDGLIIMSPQLAPDSLHLPAGLPAVAINGADGRAGIVVQNYEAALEMTRHLASAGATRIAHISGPEGNQDASERLRGYLDARPTEMGVDYVVAGDFTAASGYAAGLRLGRLDRRPDAVFAANDMMAAGCIDAFVDLGIRVPEDVAIGGFDDVPLARFLRPALTTMRTDLADLGRRALERLAAAVQGASEVTGLDLILPELVIRESSGHLGGREHSIRKTSGPGRYPE